MSEPARRKGPSAEMITAIAAVFIGVCAIAVSLYETTLIRQQLKGSAWPHVELGFSYNSTVGFRYLMTNTGVGPARLKWARIGVDGEFVEEWSDVLAQLEINTGNYLTSYMAPRVLSAGQMSEPLVLPFDQAASELWEARSRVFIDICYCSVYEDCWYARLGSEIEPVRSCAVPRP